MFLRFFKKKFDRLLGVHLFFAKNLSKSAYQILTQESKHYKEVVCYYAGTMSTPEAGLLKNIKVIPINDFSGTLTLNNNIDIYWVAKQMAEHYANLLKQQFKDFFVCQKSGMSLETVYKHVLHLQLATKEVVFIQQSMQIAKQITPQRITFLDSNLTKEHSDFLVQEIFCGERLPLFYLQTTRSIKSKLSVKQLKKKYTSNPSITKHFNLDSRQVALVLVRQDVHYRLMKDAIELLAKEYRIFICVLPTTKLDADILQELTAKYTVVNSNDFEPSDEVLSNVCEFFNNRIDQIKKTFSSSCLTHFFHLQLRNVISLYLFTISVEAIIKALRPSVILGCLEKNSYGPILYELKKKYDFQVLNFQHGMMARTWTLDRFSFDGFFIWNSLSEQAILREGYQHKDSLKVIGNPIWADVISEIEQKGKTAQSQDILLWKGNNPLIGAYSSHEADYLTRSAREKFLTALFDYMTARPDVKLLIKKHPFETDTFVEEALSRTEHRERVRIFQGNELPLWDSLQVINLATSICSTVLLDALLVHTPVVALDFENISERINYGYEGAFPILKSPENAFSILDQYLFSTSACDEKALINEGRELFYPSWNESYSTRMLKTLHEMKILKRNFA